MLSGFFALISNVLFFTGYINNAAFDRPLSKEKEKELIIKIRNGDEKAKNELAKHNMRLVAHVVKKYSSYNDNDELISVGNIGLLKAINTFDINKGFQFSTYAARCIENEILMCIRANKRYREVKSIYEPISIDADGNDSVLLDMIGSDEDDVISQIEKDLLSEKMDKLLKKCLTKDEYKIICMRYGINGSNVYTQKEIAKEFKISRSYVSRIETKAIKKIRDYIGENNVKF